MRTSLSVDDLARDARFALRQLRRQPAFTLTATITLALGIAAGVAIFAFVDAALLRPLPYRDPASLVGVFERSPQFARSNLSYLDYLDWKRLNTAFASLAAYQGTGATLQTPAGAERVAAARISDDFFQTLGVSPAAGRDFRRGEDLEGAAKVVLISDGVWRSRYGGRAVLGETVSLNGAPYEIVGVLPAAFHFAPVGSADYWMPLQRSSGCDQRRSCHNLYGVARLKDGVTLASASANMASIAAALEQQYPDSNRDQGANVVELAEVILGNVRPILWLLLGGAALLMVIASLNVAGLLVVRSESRRRELTVRSALGASTSRVIAQFAIESAVLVGVAAVLGIGLSYWAIEWLTRLIPSDALARMPFLKGITLDARALAFGLATAILAAVFFAVTPLLHVTWTGYRDGAARSARGSAGTTWRRLGSRIVVVELAVTVVLLVGAGLIGRSLHRLLSEDLGLQPDRLATVRVVAPASYAGNEQLVAQQRRLLDRVTALPGVTSAGLSSTPPLNGGNTMWIRVMGRPYNGEHNEVHYREVSAGYFATLGARLVRGRAIADQDDATHPPVVVVNEALVRKYFPGQDPIGQQLQYAPTSTQPPMEIIGIVADIKESAIDAETPATMYVAFAQDPTNGVALAVRTSQPPEALLPTLTAAVRALDPSLTVALPRTMSDTIEGSQAAYLRRAATWLVGGFAAAAWLISIVGLYGVIAYSVGQRTREIGVRMALGAPRHGVSALIVREAVTLAGAGTAIGLIGSVLSTRLLEGLLFRIGAWDPMTLGGVALVLVASSLVASYLPARRAARVNPVEALRAE
jgi:predicted permease